MEAGHVIAGKYKLSAMLARGGMGAVWRARHLGLDVDVAVKLMTPLLASSQEQRVRFTREAKAAAQLKSPHVVQIHDHGLDGDTPYIVMELLAGEDLGARLRREKRIAPATAAALATQIGRGLRKAHDIGIVHRDLKPANIFLARGDEDEDIVKILDFGIARESASGDSTLPGELLGSPPYMSPEQARGLKGIDHRTDQWAFGVVLFRMLTGALPFQSDRAGDVLVRICTERAPSPTSIAPDLSQAFNPFFARVFEHDPERRFPSVREMVNAFAAVATPGAAQHPSQINPPPPAPVIPHVPVGRTTVRLEHALGVKPAERPEPVVATSAVAAPPPPAAESKSTSKSALLITAPLPPMAVASAREVVAAAPAQPPRAPALPAAERPTAAPARGSIPDTFAVASSGVVEAAGLTVVTTTSGATTRPLHAQRSRKHGWLIGGVSLAGIAAAAVTLFFSLRPGFSRPSTEPPPTMDGNVIAEPSVGASQQAAAPDPVVTASATAEPTTAVAPTSSTPPRTGALPSSAASSRAAPSVSVRAPAAASTGTVSPSVAASAHVASAPAAAPASAAPSPPPAATSAPAAPVDPMKEKRIQW
jgi:serine/threonine-protein kinase